VSVLLTRRRHVLQSTTLVSLGVETSPMDLNLKIKIHLFSPRTKFRQGQIQTVHFKGKSEIYLSHGFVGPVEGPSSSSNGIPKRSPLLGLCMLATIAWTCFQDKQGGGRRDRPSFKSPSSYTLVGLRERDRGAPREKSTAAAVVGMSVQMRVHDYWWFSVIAVSDLIGASPVLMNYNSLVLWT
jgi:hypothetical protein